MTLALRKLPGVDAIEAAARLNYANHGEDHDYSRRVSQAVRTVFGIEDGTDFEWPAWCYDKPADQWTDAETADAGAMALEWDNHFELLSVANDEAVGQWLALGWDVTDERGHPLRCLSDFGPAMICVAKGLRGRTMVELEALVWGASLDGGRCPSDLERNRRFLGLGRRRCPERAGR